MKFDEIFLNKTEVKILRCLKNYHANMWELHGYLNFPGMENILGALKTLNDSELIYQQENADLEDYYITEDGKKYLAYISSKKRSRFWKKIGAIIGTLASLIVIAEFVMPAL